MTSRYPHLTRERSEYDIIAPLLFLSAMHRSLHKKDMSIFSFLPAIFPGSRFVEIQKFCYHVNVT